MVDEQERQREEDEAQDRPKAERLVGTLEAGCPRQDHRQKEGRDSQPRRPGRSRCKPSSLLSFGSLCILCPVRDLQVTQERPGGFAKVAQLNIISFMLPGILMQND